MAEISALRQSSGAFRDSTSYKLNCASMIEPKREKLPLSIGSEQEEPLKQVTKALLRSTTTQNKDAAIIKFKDED